MTQTELLEQALNAHMRGELGPAEALYLQVLQGGEPPLDALFLLASLYLQTNNAAAAKPLLERLVQLQPGHHDGWMQLAETYRFGNQIDLALRAYTQAHQLAPDDPHAVEGMADCLLALERPLEALPLYQLVVPLLPANAVRSRSIGNALMLSGQAAAAEVWYRQSLQLHEQDAKTWNDLGAALLKQNRLADARVALARALELSPTFSDALRLQLQLAQQGMATALKQFAAGDVAAAIGRLEELLQWQPAAESVWNNLGVMYKEQKRYSEAIHALNEAVRLAPDYSEAWNNLGNVYWAQHNAEMALPPYRTALELNPENATAWNNLGNCLQAVGQVDEAIQAFRRALQLDPEFAMAHWNHGIAALLNGDYRIGWVEYEWGLRCGLRPLKFQPLPMWQGDAADRLLVYAEQGFGDTLQFIRFVRLLRSRVAVLGLAVPPELLTLLQRSLPNVSVQLESAVHRPAYDAVMPLMSLPYRLGLAQEDELAAPVPYLVVDAEKLTAWQQKIGQNDSRLRVGILWQGSRQHKLDSLRSMPPDMLVEALSSMETDVHSLQAGPEAPMPPAGVFDWRSDIKDFDDLAAIVSALDCVVTVDTAVAHLAGALGKPVYVLLPYAPDWRWGRQGGSSRWYPTMHLLRQAVSDDWNGPLAALRQQLQKIIKKV